MFINILGENFLHASGRGCAEIDAKHRMGDLMGKNAVGDLLDNDGDATGAMGIECHRGGTKHARCPVGGGNFRLGPVKSDAELKVQRVHIEDRAYAAR